MLHTRTRRQKKKITDMYTNQLKSVHVQACHVQGKVAHHSVIHLVLCTTPQVQSNVMNATGVVWCVCNTVSVCALLPSRQF